MASDAITMIKNDHRVMERLFELLKKPGGNRAALVAEVAARLSAHSWAEEEKVYPALVKADPAEWGDVHHGLEEHHEATELLHKLQLADPASPEFDTAVDTFVEAVTHHVEEEESEILPDLAKSVDAGRLEKLGREFEERRLAILSAYGVDDEAVGKGAAVPHRTGATDVSGLTREELYELAKESDVPGRSAMTKDELAQEVSQRR